MVNVYVDGKSIDEGKVNENKRINDIVAFAGVGMGQGMQSKHKQNDALSNYVKLNDTPTEDVCSKDGNTVDKVQSCKEPQLVVETALKGVQERFQPDNLEESSCPIYLPVLTEPKPSQDVTEEWVDQEEEWWSNHNYCQAGDGWNGIGKMLQTKVWYPTI